MAEAEIRVETEPAGPAELEAKAAEVSAEHAAQAAAAAMTMASVAAAEAEVGAAERVEEWQMQINRLTQETGTALASLSDRLSAIDSREAATSDTLAGLSEQLHQLQSILSQPEPPPDEAPSPRAAEESAAEATGSLSEPVSTEAVAALAEPAREPEPARRRAHRWI